MRVLRTDNTPMEAITLQIQLTRAMRSREAHGLPITHENVQTAVKQTIYDFELGLNFTKVECNLKGIFCTLITSNNQKFSFQVGTELKKMHRLERVA